MLLLLKEFYYNPDALRGRCSDFRYFNRSVGVVIKRILN